LGIDIDTWSTPDLRAPATVEAVQSHDDCRHPNTASLVITGSQVERRPSGRRHRGEDTSRLTKIPEL
jgi:hypothetical protein